MYVNRHIPRLQLRLQLLARFRYSIALYALLLSDVVVILVFTVCVRATVHRIAIVMPQRQFRFVDSRYDCVRSFGRDAAAAGRTRSRPLIEL